MKTVLLIDDDEHLTKLVGRYLRRRGYDVATASTGKEGLAGASEKVPELIVCDLEMPEMNGFEVVRNLRNNPALADIPVIFLTGYGDHSVQRQGMNLGADDFLTKPVELEELHRAIQARLLRRESQKTRYEERVDSTLKSFIGIIHDLRNPLVALCGYADLLGSGNSAAVLAGDGPHAILERMQKAGVRLHQVIANLMLLAKSRLQQVPFNPTSFNLRDSLERFLTEHEAAARLEFHAEEGDFPIVADALRLRQMVENLVSNALKYSEGPVQIRLLRQCENYRIEIHDRGIGIPPAEQARLFEPFFRASNAEAQHGYGLGLSIVKDCVEQHGGQLRCSSTVNQGTVFQIDLPHSPAGQPSPNPSSPAPVAGVAGIPISGLKAGSAPTPALRPSSSMLATEASSTPPVVEPDRAALRAIIVDDDTLVCALLRDFLEEAGDSVILGEAVTFAEARRLVRLGPNVVFLDVRLPDGSGFDLLPHLPLGTEVVFVSGVEEYAVNAFDYDAVDFLLKPITRERFHQTLARLRTRLAAGSDVKRQGAPLSFLVNTVKGKQFVSVNEVKTIIAYGEYSWVHWGRNDSALVRKSLKQWEAELHAGQFVRAHRNAIVNLGLLDHVERLPGSRIQLHLKHTEKPILVSVRLTGSVNRRLSAFAGKTRESNSRAKQLSRMHS